MLRIFEPTADGSGTLYVPELDEHYHSVKGALTESKHIFIDMGLQATEAAHPHVLEVGLGTGLNALLAWQWADAQQCPVHYTALERYPLTWDEVADLTAPVSFTSDEVLSRVASLGDLFAPVQTLEQELPT
jgi:tRNA U34 5-methylaminomethyl-2-thiouridine-forming methyltransferase MnmC